MKKNLYIILVFAITLLALSPFFFQSFQQSRASLLFLKNNPQKALQVLEATPWENHSQTAYFHYLLSHQTTSLEIAIAKSPRQYVYINKVLSDIGFDGLPEESFHNTSSSFCLFLTKKALEACRTNKEEDILKGLSLAVQARNIHAYPETDYTIGEICRQYYKAYFHAYASFMESLHKKPMNQNYWYRLGYVFNSSKCLQGYLSCYTVNSRLNPSSISIQTGISSILSRSGYHNDAIALLEYLLRESPEDPQIYYSLGSVHQAIGQPAKAEEFYLDATYLFPDDSRTYYELGNFFYTQKEYRKALLQHTKALGLAKTQGKNVSAWWWYRKGLDYFQLQDYEGAILSFKEALSVSESSSFDYWLGRSYNANENYKEAILYYSKYLEKYPENDSVLFLEAKCFAEIGDFGKALKNAEKLLLLKPSNKNYKRHYLEWLEKTQTQ